VTVGQRWKRKRNLTLFAASGGPFSRRFLGDVFDLAHGRVAAIVGQLESESGLPATAATTEARKRWVHAELRKVATPLGRWVGG
jgi:hypothetical protein